MPWIVHPQDCGQSRLTEMTRKCRPVACFLYVCFVARAYTVMSTTGKSAYRAILRELYKAVCILPHTIFCFLPCVLLVN